MKYRDHRGGYSESMATLQEFSHIDELRSHLDRLNRQFTNKFVAEIKFEEVGFDSRNNWNTYYVLQRLDGETDFRVVGMSDGVLPPSTITEISAWVEKISEMTQDALKKSHERRVIVMHPTAIMLVKEKVTRVQNILNTREAFIFDGRFPLYVSSYLPKNHAAIMTEAEFIAFEKEQLNHEAAFNSLKNQKP